MTWKKANIIIDGRKMEIPAPDIISASRSTDIPAFYADWFFHRLETGYSVWNNPFNGKKSYTSNPQLSSSASFLRLNVLSSLN